MNHTTPSNEEQTDTMQAIEKAMFTGTLSRYTSYHLDLYRISVYLFITIGVFLGYDLLETSLLFGSATILMTLHTCLLYGKAYVDYSKTLTNEVRRIEYPHFKQSYDAVHALLKTTPYKRFQLQALMVLTLYGALLLATGEAEQHARYAVTFIITTLISYIVFFLYAHTKQKKLDKLIRKQIKVNDKSYTEN